MGRDNTAITLTFGSVGLSLDVDAYSWPKGRSPLDVERDRLPELTLDVSQAVVDAAFAAGCSWAPTQAEINSERERDARLAKIMADADAGLINLNPTAADLAEEADAKLVADNEGRDLAPNDGLFSVLIRSPPPSCAAQIAGRIRMLTAREKAARAASRARWAARRKFVQAKPEAVATTFDDRPGRTHDPGNWIAPERIAATLERIFIDPSKRLGHAAAP